MAGPKGASDLADDIGMWYVPGALRACVCECTVYTHSWSNSSPIFSLLFGKVLIAKQEPPTRQRRQRALGLLPPSGGRRVYWS